MPSNTHLQALDRKMLLDALLAATAVSLFLGFYFEDQALAALTGAVSPWVILVFVTCAFFLFMVVPARIFRFSERRASAPVGQLRFLPRDIKRVQYGGRGTLLVFRGERRLVCGLYHALPYGHKGRPFALIRVERVEPVHERDVAPELLGGTPLESERLALKRGMDRMSRGAKPALARVYISGVQVL